MVGCDQGTPPPVTFVVVQPDARPAPMNLRILMLTGQDDHDWRATTPLTKRFLEETGRLKIEVRETGDDAFEVNGPFDQYDAILFNFGVQAQVVRGTWQQDIYSYVQGGGGVVNLHYASRAFQDWTGWGELIGRYWQAEIADHGPYGRFDVTVRRADHPIMRTIPATFSTSDELYENLTVVRPVEVLATGFSPTTREDAPVLMVRNEGSGRVVNFTLGHDVGARGNATFQIVLRRALEWAATGDVVD